MKWKIFINYGTQSEFDKVEPLEFENKKSAQEWAKANGFPYKCVVKKEDYERMVKEKEKKVLMC